MAKKKQIRNVLCFLVMIVILMSALPVSILAVNDDANTTGVSNSLIELENAFTEKSPSSGDCAPVPDADLQEIYLNDPQEGVLSSDSGNDTNIIILTDVSEGTRETVSALGCDVYVKINDDTCVGYDVYVDGIYKLTEGKSGTPDGYCAFYVSAGTHKFELRKNGCTTSKSWYCQCGTVYIWVSMPDYWCEGGGGSDDCKYPPTVKFDKTKYYEGDTVHATVSTSQSSVYYKIKDCGGTIRKSGTTSNGKKISYTIPKGASECCYWQICFYWNEYIPLPLVAAGAGGEVTALSYDGTKCYNFYVCPVQTCEVYVKIEDPCCVGYRVYVDGVYQFTEGGDGTPPDGYCAFHVKEGTHTLKITKNGLSASKTINFECNIVYRWVSMPKNWCGDGEAYVEIKDKCCKGYEVYVDDVYQFTEGQTGTPDGNCGFFVTEGTKTIEIRKNGQSASLTKYFDCSYRYVWDSMPDNWCNPCADPPTVKFDKPKYNEGDAMFATVSTSSGSVNYKIKDCSGTVRKSGDRSNGGAIYYTIPKGTSKNCCNWQICFYWGENSPPIVAAAGAGGGEVTAQSYDCTKCYKFEVCPGEKPAPEIIKVEYPTLCVKEGENATISVTVENKGGTSSEGYISVSFPNDEDVSVVSGTGNGYNKLYPKGFWPLWNSKGEQMTAVDPLAELFETNWDAGEKHTLTMNVKPNSGSDTIEFLVRAALKNDADGNYERDPTSGDADQQGWYAKKYSIDVCGGDTIPVKFIGEITGEGTPISSYQFDVRVDEILSDPSGKLEVGETASVWAHGSTFTIEAGVGDRVEVLGFYRGTIEDMDKIQLENPSHFLEEQAYRWIKTDENAKFDCGTNNEYFNVSFYSDWLATQIMIEAETGENYQSRGPVLFWLNKPPDVSDWMRVLDASKGLIELWPNKFEEAKGLKIYYRITPYSTEKDKFNRVAWISKAGFESLTGENKDFVVYILGVAYGVQIFGGSDGVHDGYITTYEGNITKDFAVGDEINLDVPSGSIRLKILELKWSPKNADWLEMVKVDYEIILEGSEANILPVPYYDQGNTQWCEETTLSMILKYYGYSLHPETLAEILGVDHEDSILNNPLLPLAKVFININKEISETLGLETKELAFEVNDIKNALDSKCPIFLGMGVPIKHAVVIVGYNEHDPQDPTLFINDPRGAFTHNILGYPKEPEIAVPVKYSEVKREIDRIILPPYIGRLEVFSVKGEPAPPPGTIYLSDEDIWVGKQKAGASEEIMTPVCKLWLDRGISWKYQNGAIKRDLKLENSHVLTAFCTICNHNKRDSTYDLFLYIQDASGKTVYEADNPYPNVPILLRGEHTEEVVFPAFDLNEFSAGDYELRIYLFKILGAGREEFCDSIGPISFTIEEEKKPS